MRTPTTACCLVAGLWLGLDLVSAWLSPNSTCCATSRHDKHDVSCESWRAASCLFQHGGRRRSSGARVQNDITLYYYLLFQLTNEINSFIETNYGSHNFYTYYKQSCASRLSRSSWRAVSRLLYSMRDTQHVWLFRIPKCMTWRNQWTLGFSGYAHVFVLLSVVIVTGPLVTYYAEMYTEYAVIMTKALRSSTANCIMCIRRQ